MLLRKLFWLTLAATITAHSLASTPFTMAWARSYPMDGQASGITLDSAGNLFTLQTSSVSGLALWRVQRYDPYGAREWSQSNFFLNGSLPRGIKTDSMNNVYVYGDAVNSPPLDTDGVLYKLDIHGNPLWFNQLSGPDGKFDAYTDLGFDPSGLAYGLSSETVSGVASAVGHTIGTDGVTFASQIGAQVTNMTDVMGPGPTFAVSGSTSTGVMFAELLANGGYAFGEIAPTTNVGGVKTFYRYYNAFDPNGLLYVFQNVSQITGNVQTDSYNIRAFDSNGVVVWSAGPFAGTCRGGIVPKANQIYFAAVNVGVLNVYSMSQSQFNWAVPFLYNGQLYPDLNGGVYFAGSNGNGASVTKLNAADGSVGWTTSYTPTDSAGMGSLYCAVSAGAIHVFGSYDNMANGLSLFVVKYTEGVGLSFVKSSTSAVTGSKNVGGSVILNTPAPLGGTKVFLTSSDPAALGIPPTVVVPAGMTTTGFSIDCSAVDVLQKATVTAKALGCARGVTLTLHPNPLKDVFFASNTVKGGVAAFGTIDLSGPAGLAGRVITITSDHPAIASVPQTAYLTPGSASFNLKVVTQGVAVSTPVVISATWGGVTKTFTLNVTP